MNAPQIYFVLSSNFKCRWCSVCASPIAATRAKDCAKCEEKRRHNIFAIISVTQYVRRRLFTLFLPALIINFQCKSCTWDVYLEFCKCSYLFNARTLENLSSFVRRLIFFLFFVMKERRKKTIRLADCSWRAAVMLSINLSMMAAQARGEREKDRGTESKRERKKQRETEWISNIFPGLQICGSIALIDMHLFLFTYWWLLIADGHFMFISCAFVSGFTTLTAKRKKNKKQHIFRVTFSPFRMFSTVFSSSPDGSEASPHFSFLYSAFFSLMCNQQLLWWFWCRKLRPCHR